MPPDERCKADDPPGNLGTAMKLRDLLSGVPTLAVEGPLDLPIAEVRDDSRAVGAGDLFVAMPGQTVDGHDFLAAAAGAGATAALVERDVPASTFPGTRVRVASAARALALVAANRFGRPATDLRLIGITGTNGKTTTTFLVESILRAAGASPGVIGTVNYRFGGRVLPAPFTTPTPIELHRALAEMKGAGTTDVVMETSSHALALGRLDGLEFRVGAFTNLTQDHLDFHGTMDAYFEAKSRLMRGGLRPRDGVGVIFVDGEWGPKMADAVVGNRLLVSLRPEGSADVRVLRAECTIEGIRAELASPIGVLRVRSRLLGRYNLANVAVAAAIGIALGLPAQAIEAGIERLAGVPGRIERVQPPSGASGAPTVLVDYAHSHDALENVIAALRPLTRGRLLCVFGCGGDRDRTKRPKMGRAVARDADLAIVTSDNPRTEDPGSIIAMILEGVRGTGTPMLDAAALPSAARGAWVESDRRQAIRAVVAAARPEDVVLIAGKGHEDYQIIGRTKFPFDDREVAREALAQRGGGRQS